MTGMGHYGRLSRPLRLIALGAGCVALANCANGNMTSRVVKHEHHRVRNADRTSIYYAADTTSNSSRARIVGGRPTGCPRLFCGCEASRYVFGKIRPDLNLASNWMRKFPHAAPAPGMAAVRNHHVFVLISHVDGSNWLVHDGNSGHGLTRQHVRSIEGYTVVDPHGTRITPSVYARAE